MPGWGYARDWMKDNTERFRRLDIPDAGGYLLEVTAPGGFTSHVFVPDLDAWASAIAQAINKVSHADDPVKVALDFDSVRVTPQPRPGEPLLDEG